MSALGAGRAAADAPALESPVIDLQDVHKVYGEGATDVHAVRGITLRVEPGDYVAVMGASGSGKSTLMHIIGCLDVPTSGRYLLDGHRRRRPRRVALALVRNREGRLRLPGVQPAPADDHAWRTSSSRWRTPGVASPRATAAGARGARGRRPGATVADRRPEPALGGPAAAGRGRARPGDRPVAAPRRRADREPRQRVDATRSSRCSTGPRSADARSSWSRTSARSRRTRGASSRSGTDV